MNKIIKNSIFALVSIFATIQIGTLSHTSKNTSFVESTLSSQSMGAKSVKKLVGNDEVISNSKIYTQYAELENSYVLRFATAIKGNITSLSYTRAKVGEHNENVKEVATVYRGIIADSKTYFYDGNDLTTNEAYAGNYYWACYTISYTKDSSLIETPINLSLAINGEEKVTIQKALKELIHVAVTDIKLSNMNLYNNQIVFDLNNPTTQNLNATALPSNATLVNNITYEIEDTSIASVTDKGDITPLSEGKTTLTIKCDEIIKAVTIRVVKLDDSSLINDDDKDTLGKIDASYNIPGWYSTNTVSSCPISMQNNIITYKITKKLNTIAQIRYLPKSSDGSPYIGNYLLAFTAKNNTSGTTKFKCNLNGNLDVTTSEFTLNNDDSDTYSFVFNSTKSSEFLNIKFTQIGSSGTFTISNIHFIALSD